MTPDPDLDAIEERAREYLDDFSFEAGQDFQALFAEVRRLRAALDSEAEACALICDGWIFLRCQAGLEESAGPTLASAIRSLRLGHAAALHGLCDAPRVAPPVKPDPGATPPERATQRNPGG